MYAFKGKVMEKLFRCVLETLLRQRWRTLLVQVAVAVHLAALAGAHGDDGRGGRGGGVGGGRRVTGRGRPIALFGYNRH